MTPFADIVARIDDADRHLIRTTPRIPLNYVTSRYNVGPVMAKAIIQEIREP